MVLLVLGGLWLLNIWRIVGVTFYREGEAREFSFNNGCICYIAFAEPQLRRPADEDFESGSGYHVAICSEVPFPLCLLIPPCGNLCYLAPLDPQSGQK
jgi:hypothetical protein